MGINKFVNSPCYCKSGKKFKSCHKPILDNAKKTGRLNISDLPVEMQNRGKLKIPTKKA